MRIALAADHAGFSLKEKIKRWLARSGHTVSDCGVTNETRSDYPDEAKKATTLVAQGVCKRGVLICGSGIGMCMTANRVKGIRAAVIRDEGDAQMSRLHNDANVACFGGRVTPEEHAVKLLDLFLSTEFEGGRHTTRVKKIDEV